MNFFKNLVIVSLVILLFFSGIFFLIKNKDEVGDNNQVQWTDYSCDKIKNTPISGVVVKKDSPYLYVSSSLESSDEVKININSETSYVQLSVDGKGEVIKEENIKWKDISVGQSVVVLSFCNIGEKQVYQAELVKIISYINQ